MTHMFKTSGISRPVLLSSALALGVVAFLATAEVVDIDSDNNASPEKPEALRGDSPPLPSVHATQFPQQLTSRQLTLYGRTEADRVITISAEMPARVVAIESQRGERVESGEEIVRLREGSLKAQLKSARVQLKQAKQEYQSSLALFKKNHIAENTLTMREVAVAQAESVLEQLQIRWDNTRIKAPVAGILNERHVELGDFIDTGKPVAEILDLDPLVVRVDVPQSEIAGFTVGDKAQVRFITGQSAEATIRYIDRQADAATRTFAIELTLPNPDMSMPAGLSVEADLVLNQVTAIEVTPALLALSKKGDPGIKWVDSMDTVQFSPVDIIKSGSNSLWLSGIPSEARIITRGQGFVRIGDRVTVTDAKLLAGE